MKNSEQIEIIEKDIANAKQVLEESIDEKIRECFRKLRKFYADQDKSLSFRSIAENKEWRLSILDYLAYKEDLETMIRKLELYCAKLKDTLTHTPSPNIHINNSPSISANATINQIITFEQILQSIQEIPSSSIGNKDKAKLEELLASIEGLKNINKEKAKSKISEVLRFVADKGVDVGIAVLPWILEVMKGL
ncbi:hypothetical protein [Helicobacter pametensis]|uniref:hypothetical protein n=1 Tax=Helicobacter pametensis TaxID=95149 RepID=UPI000487A015|nr:hypothetical protein [Helicobacter pametensis]